jgi:hypothetical protein
VNGAVTLTEAITALVGDKRAVGYKYDAEARVLARFVAFSRREVPGLDTVTEASVQAWITAARGRGVTPATLQGLAAPVRELARWLGRRGEPAYLLPRAALPRPDRYVPHIGIGQSRCAVQRARLTHLRPPRSPLDEMHGRQAGSVRLRMQIRVTAGRRAWP